MGDSIKIVIGMILGGTLLFGINLFMQPKQAYVSKEKLFADFTGKQELEAKLSYMRQRHKYILDSLSLELSALQTAATQPELFMKKRDFYLNIKEEFAIEDNQKSTEYTTQIWKQVRQYVKEYGDQQGYDFIFGLQQGGAVMYAKEGTDITEELTQFINRKYEGN